jgi:hypothetical protein
MSDPQRLAPLAEGLWGAEHDLFLPGGMCFRGRMTVVRLSSGELLLHSVVPIDDALAEELSGLGAVTQIVAPNSYHHVHLTPALKRYPDAILYGPAALAKRRKRLSFQTLPEALPDPLNNDLEALLVEGAPALDEVLFFHKPSQSLIVTDYFFNIRETRGWLTPWMLRLVGAHKRFAQSRSWRLIVKERALARSTAEKVLALPFERIIMAHGEPLEEGAKAQAQQALSWLMGKAPPQLAV